MKYILMLLTLLAFALPLSAMAGENVIYHDGDTTLEGYWAKADCAIQTTKPTVLIVHQWKGLGDYEKTRADMLAKECYNVMAIDMYGQGVRPATQEEAGTQAGIYKTDPALARRRLTAALDFARTQPDVDAEKMAVMGYCFGGTMALELARSGADIDGAISFHGGLATRMPAIREGAIKASIQIHHGADDPHVPPQEVETFINEMNAAHADWVFTAYAGAVHAFTEKEAGNDPSTGVAYNEKADKRSWAATLDFLKEIFSR